MPELFAPSLAQLSRDGFTMLEAIFDEDEALSIANRLSAVLEDESESSVLRSRGHAYGSRNLLEMFPEVGLLFNCSRLRQFAAAVLGTHAGVVRALYFDKPPGHSWSLPWHRDKTIAVKQNDLSSQCFQKPTRKAGVPHVEAPAWLLDRMLTLRIHLDPMHAENGPLCVIPGSHLEDHRGQADPLELHANPGDVLAMRPLLSHASGMSRPGTRAHRRIIHIELAEDVVLPDGYEWYSFVPLTA